MGTIRNEMTIVHHYDKDELKKVREDAVKVFSQIIRQDAYSGVEEYIKNMISPIMEAYINQEYTFVINGDCSKIGWETSERFHKARMEWCEKHKHDVQNIIVINFGEGDEPCQIVFDSQAESEMERKEEKHGQGVIIQDMEMPDSCFDCNLHNYHFCYCTCESIEENYDDGTRNKKCPLKPYDEVNEE